MANSIKITNFALYSVKKQTKAATFDQKVMKST